MLKQGKYIIGERATHLNKVLLRLVGKNFAFLVFVTGEIRRMKL